MFLSDFEAIRTLDPRLRRDYFIHFSNFIEILLAYLKNLPIFVSDFGARILDSRGVMSEKGIR